MRCLLRQLYGFYNKFYIYEKRAMQEVFSSFVLGLTVICLIVYVANSAETQFLRCPKELAARSFTRSGHRALPS